MPGEDLGFVKCGLRIEKRKNLGFLIDLNWNCFSAHSSLDEHVAHWFGLNQSKYQWALDDYYESNGKVHIENFISLYQLFMFPK